MPRDNRKQRVLAALTAGGYRCAWQVPPTPERDFALEGWIGGKLGVVIVQIWADDLGIDCYRSVSSSNTMNELLEALSPKGGN